MSTPEVVGIGANVCDTLIVLPRYTPEDTKQKADAVSRAGGGPCATGLVAAAKLGARAAMLGNLSADGDGDFLLSDFERFGVGTAYLHRLPACRAFTSYVMLSRESASRTIVFDRGNVPPLVPDDAQLAAVRDARVLLVDGNELDAAVTAATVARESGTTVVYDAGGRYAGVERLLPLCDYLIPSEEFALGVTGERDAAAAARALHARYRPRAVIVTQGKAGGVYYDGADVRPYPAFPVDTVDSNGAGDVFHGAFCAALVRGMDPYTACIFSSAVSAVKCTRIGSRDGVPDYETTLQFLKEHGYEL